MILPSNYTYPPSPAKANSIVVLQGMPSDVTSALSNRGEKVFSYLTNIVNDPKSAVDFDYFEEADIFKLGLIWQEITKENISLKQIIELIQHRRADILEQKNQWNEYIETHDTGELMKKYEKQRQSLKIHRLITGCGGTYLVTSKENVPLMIIKPIDEDIMCLNNSKHYANLFNDETHVPKKHIPLYYSHQTHLLCHLIAKELGIAGTTPKAEIAIIRSDAFHDLSSVLSQENSYLKDAIGCRDTEKLCCIQEYIPHTKSLQDLVYEYLNKGNSHNLICDLDQENIENLNLMAWITFDNDAHPGNFLVSELIDPHTHAVQIKLTKIDNSMTFPKENLGFNNFLFILDRRSDPISDRLRETIAYLDEEAIVKYMTDLKFPQEAMLAFYQRIYILKELAKKPSISLFEINLRFELLSRPNGAALSLSEYSLKDLEQFLSTHISIDSKSEGSF